MDGRDADRICRMKTACVVLFLALLLPPGASHAGQPLKIGDPPPAFALQDLDGRTISIPGTPKGQVVIIHFWADWCQYCLEEMPALDRLYREYRGRGLIIYAVNVGQSAAAAKAYVQRVKISYPVLVDGSSRTAKDYDVKGLPRTFFLDRKGMIKYKLLGEASEETLRKLILKML